MTRTLYETPANEASALQLAVSFDSSPKLFFAMGIVAQNVLCNLLLREHLHDYILLHMIRAKLINGPHFWRYAPISICGIPLVRPVMEDESHFIRNILDLVS